MPRSDSKNGPNLADNQSNAHCPTLALSPGNTSPPRDKWPKGTKQRLTRKFAKSFCDILATSDDSVFGILHNHPEFPPYTDLFHWKYKFPWFKQLWQNARESQAEHFVQMSIDIAKRTTPATAHVARVQFDIYKWVAGKFAPAVYGDKPAQNAFQANVNVNVSLVTNDKLQELRQRLTPTRVFIKAKADPAAFPAQLKNGSDASENVSPTLNKDWRTHEGKKEDV